MRSRIGVLLVVITALIVSVNGQSSVQAPQADATWKTTSLSVGSGDKFTLPDGSYGWNTRVTAQGVEIRIGNSVLIADEAEAGKWLGTPGLVELELRGNVRLKTLLDPHQPQ